MPNSTATTNKWLVLLEEQSDSLAERITDELIGEKGGTADLDKFLNALADTVGFIHNNDIENAKKVASFVASYGEIALDALKAMTNYYPELARYTKEERDPAPAKGKPTKAEKIVKLKAYLDKRMKDEGITLKELLNAYDIELS